MDLLGIIVESSDKSKCRDLGDVVDEYRNSFSDRDSTTSDHTSSEVSVG
jgi:hypothetical protein